MSLFKRLYNFFGSLLSILTITLIALFIALIVLSLFIGILRGKILLPFVQLLILLIFVVSIYYLVAGMFALILMKLGRGKEERLVNVKRMILRGVAGIAVLFLLYLLIYETASLFARNYQGLRGPPHITDIIQ